MMSGGYATLYIRNRPALTQLDDIEANVAPPQGQLAEDLGDLSVFEADPLLRTAQACLS